MRAIAGDPNPAAGGGGDHQSRAAVVRLRPTGVRLVSVAAYPGLLACGWKDLESRGIRPPSWVLADRLIRDGLAGIVVPSYARGATVADINVVFWDWSPTLPHQVRVVDD